MIEYRVHYLDSNGDLYTTGWKPLPMNTPNRSIYLGVCVERIELGHLYAEPTSETESNIVRGDN